ncbi:CBM_HP2_G0000840.mRNA.1.CDS.1 [Saccharomyces cerevisiae]|nr:CBM_HP2_G0000840.mRNA.1.CDS.1 [Saccharomyces cerevisiae]CAI6384800.1 CBM_HP2_G0000840.mRNA.1.CDS.1 [Saccharomyces cerevisiae]
MSLLFLSLEQFEQRWNLLSKGDGKHSKFLGFVTTVIRISFDSRWCPKATAVLTVDDGYRKIATGIYHRDQRVHAFQTGLNWFMD